MTHLHENAVRGEPGGTTVPARVLNQEAGRALILVEDDGEHLRYGDIVTVDTSDLTEEDYLA